MVLILIYFGLGKKFAFELGLHAFFFINVPRLLDFDKAEKLETADSSPSLWLMITNPSFTTSESFSHLAGASNLFLIN